MGNYNEFAQTYKEQTELSEKETREHTRSLLPNLKGMVLLDVGCGSGQDVPYYVSQGADAYGIDISEEEIKIAKEFGIGNFVVGSMNALPYKSNSFDVVTSVYALQASDDVPQAMSEMVRVLKPGGTLLILTKHPFRNLLESHVNDGNSHYYEKRMVTSYIFERSIKLSEPGHTMMDYLSPDVLSRAKLDLFEEHTDFPASEQVISRLIYPTYMIMRFTKL